MIIILKPTATEADAQEILSQIEEAGLKPLHMPGVERTVIGALGDERILQSLHFDNHPQLRALVFFPYIVPLLLFHILKHWHQLQYQ